MAGAVIVAAMDSPTPFLVTRRAPNHDALLAEFGRHTADATLAARLSRLMHEARVQRARYHRHVLSARDAKRQWQQAAARLRECLLECHGTPLPPTDDDPKDETRPEDSGRDEKEQARRERVQRDRLFEAGLDQLRDKGEVESHTTSLDSRLTSEK